MGDIQQEIFHARYSTRDIPWEKFYERYSMGDIPWEIGIQWEM